MEEKIGEGCSGNDHLHVRYVPEELVIDILLKLPVESLVRCKAVCKNWYILITSSDLIKDHFNHYHRNNNHTRLLVYHYFPSPTLETPGFEALSHESLARLQDDLDYLRTPLQLQHIVGPVKGLLVLCHGRHRRPHDYPLALLNPATRELRPLFSPNSNQNHNIWSDLHTFGFGFDPLTNDFKVVVFSDLLDRKLHWEIGLMKIAVYSLANDSWKHLEPYKQTPRNSPSPYSGTTYFNGACYWLSCDQECLLSFDLGSEVMREINGPQGGWSAGISPFVYKNEALAIFRYQGVHLIDLMVMKEEGCWTKYFTMDLSDSHQYLRVNRPVGICKNNRLFVVAHIIQPEDDQEGDKLVSYDPPVVTHEIEEDDQGDKLVLYDPITRDIEEVRVPCSFPYINEHDVFSYNESLISVKGGGGNKSLSIGDFCSSRTK